ncbi:MAG TPA: hypothetical protein VE195_09450 [Acidobacteriaceae bacterium]|nr:hypothetical protein [Acidobacteriaceae bacterium]
MNQLLPIMLGSTLLVSTGCSAADHDFNSVVSAVEHKYSVHAQRIPMMTLVSICASLKTHGGVRGLQVAEFDNVRGLDGKELYPLLRSRLGDEWQPFVTESGGKGRSGDQSVILVHPDGSSMGMMIADYDHGELDLVGMEMNGGALAKWLHDPERQQHSSYPGSASGN